MLLPLALFAPSMASAQTVSQFLGLFNICAGLMVVVGIVLFLGGFVGYLVVLGTDKRKQGLYVMMWGITVLFVLAVILGVINMLQGPLAFLLGMGVIIFLAIVIIISISKFNSAPPPEHK